MKEILFLTDATSISIYVIIAAIIFITGYMSRATAIYNTAIKNNREEIAAYAWYPFVNVITMAKLAKCTYIPAIITSLLLFLTVAISAVVMIIKAAVIPWLISLTVVIYVLYCACHFFVLKKYMNKFYPDRSASYIVFASLVPFFKYLIHINF